MFDEAHHCQADHPANRIMAKFYHPKKAAGDLNVPSILGLTASPIMNRRGGGLQWVSITL